MSTPIEQNTLDLQTLLDKVNALPEAGGSADPVLQDKTVTPTTSSQTITPDSGYDGLSQVTVDAMPTATQATPSIIVSSTGLITASATQTAGYVAAGTKSATHQLSTQAARTITPSKAAHVAVDKDKYTTGAITVAAIPSYYITTTDATAAAADIRSGETAYVNGSKVTGSIEDFDGSYTCSEDSTGSGSSGTSIETYTVVFVHRNGMTDQVMTYTTFESNQLITKQIEDTSEYNDTYGYHTTIIENVVKNTSIVYTPWDGSIFFSFDCENAEMWTAAEAYTENTGMLIYNFKILGDAVINIT